MNSTVPLSRYVVQALKVALSTKENNADMISALKPVQCIPKLMFCEFVSSSMGPGSGRGPYLDKQHNINLNLVNILVLLGLGL